MEFGIFTDEGCIECGFDTRDSAEAVAETTYRQNQVPCVVKEMCPDHEEQARETCETCNAEDTSDWMPS